MPPGFTDAHVHFWDRSLRAYPWLDEAPAIAGPHGPADLLREARGAAPDRVVFVQADCARESAADEVSWVESLAAGSPRIAGIVAFAPMDLGAGTRAALLELASRPLVKGVRHLIQGERDPRFCLRPEFVAGVRLCGELGLTFDLCVRHFQLGAAVDLARLCPGTTLILDHAGKPDLAANLLDPWRSHIRDLASLPNTLCKVSGLVTEAGGAAADIERFRPVVLHLIACFGPNRLLFGSDWPVVKLASPYPAWLAMVQSLLSHLTDGEREAVFSGNAGRAYRLD